MAPVPPSGLEDRYSVVAQLLNALLDVCHGCVQRLHREHLLLVHVAFPVITKHWNEKSQACSSHSFLGMPPVCQNGHAASPTREAKTATDPHATIILWESEKPLHCQISQKVLPSCGASSWHPEDTTGCTALPLWTHPQCGGAGAHAAVA